MFDAAARHLSFRAASDELNLTQGAVAQQVRQLEKTLGISLFHRLPRGLALTEAGAAYHAEIRRALSLIDRATERIGPGAGKVTLSLPPSLAAKWLLPRLADFTKAHPDITLQTQATERMTDFRDGVDIAIRQGTPPFPETLSVRRLSRLEICAVAAPMDVTAPSDPKTAEAFVGCRLIEDGHRLWTRLLGEGATQHSRMLNFNQTALAIDAALAGQGIALAPRLLVRADIEAGRLTRLWSPPADPETGFYLLTPTDPRKGSAAGKLYHWLIEQAESGM